MNKPFDFYTSYNTFFITSDNGKAINPNWMKDQDDYFSTRLSQTQNLLAIRTGSYGHIKGNVIVFTSYRKDSDNKAYSHIVEGGLEVTSGTIQILECPGSQVELKIKVLPGTYRVRVYSANLESADIDEDEGDDYYKVEIWPDKNLQRKVLKQYIAK